MSIQFDLDCKVEQLKDHDWENEVLFHALVRDYKQGDKAVRRFVRLFSNETLAFNFDDNGIALWDIATCHELLGKEVTRLIFQSWDLLHGFYPVGDTIYSGKGPYIQFLAINLYEAYEFVQAIIRLSKTLND